MSSRVITVYGITSYVNADRRYVEVPSIRIQGKWVGKLGFQIGDKVEVYEGEEEITIRLAKGQEKGGS